MNGHPGGHPGGRPGAGGDAPLLLVAWETTRRCPLACKHCRGAARNQEYEGELTGGEARRMIDSIASFAKPILIMTGGEPMFRKDVYEQARYATDKGLTVVMSPCGSLITEETAKKMKDSGIQRISISLDGANSETHDEFRGVPGAFKDSLRGIEYAKAAGIEFQINTTVSTHNVKELPELLELSRKIGAVVFNPFFLVPTGRGKAIEHFELSPEDYEKTLNWIYEKSLTEQMEIRITCAPHYYRVTRQRQAAARAAGESAEPKKSHRVGRGCLGGQGFVFVSYDGMLQPCGFLELECGNLRESDFDFKKLYLESKEFLSLRNRKGYKGKCGACGFLNICGGCRARANAQTGDYLAEEPYCSYEPSV